jgi:signal transduction histidine kinase
MADGDSRASAAEERRLREIIDHLADGILIVSSDGRISFANPAAEQLFARSARSLAGTELGFPIANGVPAEIELVRPDGKAVTAELRVVDVMWEGDPARLVSVRDITDRRRAEERTRQVERERAARAEAEAASRAKSEFLATMSHELRTPLNAVVGYAHLLDIGIGGSLSPEQRQQVDRILASSRHLLGLVNEVLDLAKVDAGRLGVQIAPTPAQATVDVAVTLVQPAAEARGVSLTVRSVGDDDAMVYYDGDEDRVRQILVNLLSNAVKFTGAGGNVAVEYGRAEATDAAPQLGGAGRWTFFRVTDTGVGIAASQLAAIFEPFVQADAGRTRSNDGSGLGLAISRRLARLMRGDITVESKVGEGSSFVLWLPLTESTASESQAEASRAPAMSARAPRLADVGEVLMRELYPLLDAFVSRLRVECPVRGAGALKFSHLADHVGSYLADLAGILVALDEANGQPSSVLVDAAEIHRVVAARHGAQRLRLGWTEDAIRCEYRILREEIERAVRQSEPSVGSDAADEALVVVDRLLTRAEQISLGSFVRASSAATPHS